MLGSGRKSKKKERSVGRPKTQQRRDGTLYLKKLNTAQKSDYNEEVNYFTINQNQIIIS